MGIEDNFILSHPQLIRRGPQGRTENIKIPKFKMNIKMIYIMKGIQHKKKIIF